MPFFKSYRLTNVGRFVLTIGGGLLLLSLTFSCAKRYSYTFNFTSNLADGGSVSMTVKAEFKNKQDAIELKDSIERIKYALHLVFSRQTSSELRDRGKSHTTNALFKIIDQSLHLRPKSIQITSFDINTRDK